MYSAQFQTVSSNSVQKYKVWSLSWNLLTVRPCEIIFKTPSCYIITIYNGRLSISIPKGEWGIKPRPNQDWNTTEQILKCDARCPTPGVPGGNIWPLSWAGYTRCLHLSLSRCLMFLSSTTVKIHWNSCMVPFTASCTAYSGAPHKKSNSITHWSQQFS